MAKAKGKKASKKDKGPKPIKEKLSRTALASMLAKGILETEVRNWPDFEENEAKEEKFALDLAKVFLEGLDDIIVRSLLHYSKGKSEFTLPQMFTLRAKQIPAKKMPAIKKGTLVRMPSTGEMEPSKGRAAFTKAASVRFSARGLKRLKDSVA